MTKLPLDRNHLSSRHRLSHQQIDMLLGQKESKENLPEKLKGLKLVSNFLQLVDLLDAHHLEFLSFKGPLLSQLIYGDASVRISHDFDILIDPSDINRAHALLTSNNFEVTDDIKWPQEALRQKILFEAIHHLGFRHKELGYMVEIHWTLVNESPISPKKLNRMVWSNTKTYEMYGRTIRSLNEEMLLAYLIIHGTKHGWQRLKWLVDIKDFPLDKISEENFKELCRMLNIQKAVAQTGALLKTYFNFESHLFPTRKASSFLVNHSIKMVENPIKEKLPVGEAIEDLKYKIWIFGGLSYKIRIISKQLIGITDINNVSFKTRLAYILYRPYSFIKRRIYHA